MKYALVTGANRGIGLELCKVLKQENYQVVAVCRKSSKPLTELGVTVIDSIDVTSEEAITKLASQIKDNSLDLLINNAGVLVEDKLNSFKAQDLLLQFQVNAMGPLMVTRSLLEKMKSPSKIAMITSRMGSIEDNGSGSYYGYRASKAALNAFAKSLAIDLRAQSIAVGLLHPGYVQTDMTQHLGDITPAQSAKLLYQRIIELNLDNTGSFWHCQGEQLPW